MQRDIFALLGTEIGHIRVVDVLGQGGMGAVYAGFDSALQRKVALKVIRSEFRLEPEAKTRFLREARILSALDHSGICKVHDYVEGADHDVLVLELVDGCNLHRAIEQGLPESVKLAIARQLLEVLAAVHARGVVHRDLKPENVMISGRNQVKVLDFGLARSAQDDRAVGSKAPTLGLPGGPNNNVAVGLEPGMTPLLTHAGTVLGTAGYMSPEQARGESATAASDMYSAGLILQELFTGQAPFDRDLPPEVLIERAAAGATSPVTGLRPELTAFITRLKGIEPGTRPSSVDALEHLQRIIDRPRRRRRRLLVAAVWLALALFGGGMTVQSVRAWREAKRAALEAETAREVSDFLVGLFQLADPVEGKGDTVTVREVLDRGAEKIEYELAGQPLLQARLKDTMGLAYQELGLYGESRQLLETALAQRQGLLGPENVEVGRSLNSLARQHAVEGDFDQAESLYRRGLSVLETALGERDLEVAVTLNDLGVVCSSLGRYDEAERLYRRSLEISEEVLGPDHIDVAEKLSNLATLYTKQGRFDEAELGFSRSLAIREKVLGADHPALGTGLNNLAVLYLRQGRKERAEPLVKRSLELAEAAYGPDHPNVATGLNNLANLYRSLGRLDEAQPLFQRSLAIREQTQGKDHPEVAVLLINIALVEQARGLLAEAEHRLRRAVSIQRQGLDALHPDLAQGLKSLANVVTAQGRHREAEPLFREALEICEQALPADHPRLASVLEGYARMLRAAGRADEADAAAARAAEIRERRKAS